MGLPQILIDFESKGTNAIRRSARGVVACILRDATAPEEALSVYTSLEKVDYTKWTERNREYMKLIFMGAPAKLIVARLPEEGEISGALAALRDLHWNYLAAPGATPSEVTELSAWIKEQRDSQRKTFKAVLPASASDHEGVINLTTDGFVVLDGETQNSYSTAEYCARIAGLLAGLPLSRSSTNYPLDEIVRCDVPADADERIDAGEFVIVFDGDRYVIGRGVNSLVTTEAKGKDLQKITIVEKKDMYQDDISDTFRAHYLGMVINDYDNKQALVAAINSYHRALAGDVLDASYDNVAEISFDGQREYLASQNIDVETMTDQQILQANTGSHVFLRASIKFVDAMEDLDMLVAM